MSEQIAELGFPPYQFSLCTETEFTNSLSFIFQHHCAMDITEDAKCYQSDETHAYTTKLMCLKSILKYTLTCKDTYYRNNTL